MDVANGAASGVVHGAEKTATEYHISRIKDASTGHLFSTGPGATNQEWDLTAAHILRELTYRDALRTINIAGARHDEDSTRASQRSYGNDRAGNDSDQTEGSTTLVACCATTISSIQSAAARRVPSLNTTVRRSMPASFGNWTLIGAVKSPAAMTSPGSFHTGSYTVSSVDSNGNYLRDFIVRRCRQQ